MVGAKMLLFVNAVQVDDGFCNDDEYADNTVVQIISRLKRIA